MKVLLTLATVIAVSGTSNAVECGDALKEVNRERARRGLRPFKPDAKLARAAMAAAKYRAKRLIAGHTSNDFHYLPKGGRATATGCAAWPRGSGWGSCCTYDIWRRAGAAWALGRDGNRYMHLFVR
jgi:hypothetical protein